MAVKKAAAVAAAAAVEEVLGVGLGEEGLVGVAHFHVSPASSPLPPSLLPPLLHHPHLPHHRPPRPLPIPLLHTVHAHLMGKESCVSGHWEQSA